MVSVEIDIAKDVSVVRGINEAGRPESIRSTIPPDKLRAPRLTSYVIDISLSLGPPLGSATHCLRRGD